MAHTERLQHILEIYREDVKTVEKNKKPFDGLLGMGKAPANDPCHDRMDQGIEALMQQAADETSGCSSMEIDDLVSELLRAEKIFDGPEYAHIALIAAQRHGIALISAMSAEGREALLSWYDKAYPKRMRFPMQKKIVTELSK